MVAARAMAGGGRAVVPAVVVPTVVDNPNDPPAAEQAAPPAVPPPARRCVFANCTSDTPTEGLRECACGNGPHHHVCSIAAGCEEDASLCAICLGVPVFAPPVAATEAAPEVPPAEVLDDAQIADRLAALHCSWADVEQTELIGTSETDVEALRTLLDQMGVGECTLRVPGSIYTFERSLYGDRLLNCASQPVAAVPAHVADEEWTPIEGGPWTARLMRPSRQPVPTALYRNYYIALPINALSIPGGLIKFPIVAGAPPEGIVCRLPSTWSPRQRSHVFKLKLSKTGATENAVNVNSVLYLRSQGVESDAGPHHAR